MSYKKYDGQSMFGTCGYDGADSNEPLTFYRRTKEWLCENHLKIRKREEPARKKIKREDQEKDMWDRIRNIEPEPLP